MPLNAVPVTQPRFFDTALTNGLTYTYRVKSIDTALRQSAPSASVTATPRDAMPPGRLTDVRAFPERQAGAIKVSWRRGLEADVDHYQVYRSTVEGELGAELAAPLSPVPASGAQEEYAVVDATCAQGTTYFYSVNAVDQAGNVSTASAQVAARPRHSGVSGANILSWTLVNDDKGTSGPEVSAEDDDVVGVQLKWHEPSSAPDGYAVYRKSPEDDRYLKVGSITGSTPGPTGHIFWTDTTIRGASSSYFVCGWKDIAGETEESGGGAVMEVPHPFDPGAHVRTLFLTDSRRNYSTLNKESRDVRIDWSRVTEPALRGYNLYRMCAFGPTGEGFSMETFACEPDWVRVNEALIPPETRHFSDSSVGGLEGDFLYAVRPVGPDGEEGPITKVVVAGLSAGQSLDANAEYHFAAAGGYWHDNVTQDFVPIATSLTAINAIPRGTGDPTAPLPAPSSAARSVFRKLTPTVPEGSSERLAEATRVAQVTWTMPGSASDLPSDLKGFHVEMAGSRDGPWKRVTNRPVAWWERRYSVQGVDVEWGGMRYASHVENCVSFRVMAVDEDGNLSAPTPASNNPSSAACPATPPAPANLRASSIDRVDPPVEHRIRLDWDPSPGATNYVVYRLVLWGGHRYFYPTAVVTTNAYEERGNDTTAGSTPDTRCPYDEAPNCVIGGELEAYYVTARAGTPGAAYPGESPRSEVVFIKWGEVPPYARLDDPAFDSWDAVAEASSQGSPELLACWEREPLAELDDMIVASRSALDPAPFAVAPMRTLGTLANPPWALLDLHTDHLGTVRLITDASGTVVSEHKYFPFGEPTVAEAPGDNTHKYTGHERDGESGLDYMLARYYGSGLGRFLSKDPLPGARRIPNPQGWNAYTYALNNPIKFFDPDGNDIVLAPGSSQGFTSRMTKAFAQGSRHAETSTNFQNAETSSATVVVKEGRLPVEKTATGHDIGIGKTEVTKTDSAGKPSEITVTVDTTNISNTWHTGDRSEVVTDVEALSHEFAHVNNQLTPEGRSKTNADPQGEEDAAKQTGEDAAADPATEKKPTDAETQKAGDTLKKKTP